MSGYKEAQRSYKQESVERLADSVLSVVGTQSKVEEEETHEPWNE